MEEHEAVFDQAFRSWAEAACEEWGYEPVDEGWVRDAYGRLPRGLRSLLGSGIEQGLVETVEGFRFRLAGLPAGKGPYAWLGRAANGVPAVHWEYYVQAAEYTRLATARGGLAVSFEDELMDVTAYRDGQLLLACEVKERASQLPPLLEGIRRYAGGFDPTEPDRGNDPLRKAKYITRARPAYFSLAAIGQRLEFSVDYRPDGTFTLTEDVAPLP
jgi:hypothetical protein